MSIFINEVNLALAIKNVALTGKTLSTVNETVLITLTDEKVTLETTNRYMATSITIDKIEAPEHTSFSFSYRLDKLVDWAKTVKTSKPNPYACGLDIEKNLLSAALGEIVLEPEPGFPHVPLLDAEPVTALNETAPGNMLFALDYQFMKALPAAPRFKGVEFYRVAPNTIGFKSRINDDVTWRSVIQGMTLKRDNGNAPVWEDEVAA